MTGGLEALTREGMEIGTGREVCKLSGISSFITSNQTVERQKIVSCCRTVMAFEEMIFLATAKDISSVKIKLENKINVV